MVTQNSEEPHGAFVCASCLRVHPGTQDEEQTVSWVERHPCLGKPYSFSSRGDLSTWFSKKPVNFTLTIFTHFMKRRHSDVRKFAYH